MERASGVLLHISSLPGEYGIGSLGENARNFVDFLKKAGFTYWQILPLNEPDECNSPYKSASAFAGNPALIDLAELELLLPDELEEVKQDSSYLCEFELIETTRIPLLKKAFSRIDRKRKGQIKRFIALNQWVVDYAEFKALKVANNNARWQDWEIFTPNKEEFDFYCFLQHEFFRQWKNIKEYANINGIKFIGDMPFYVALDSADVYYNREIFLLDSDGEAIVEAGVPPDYFSEEGQGWGNPIYDWDKLKKNDYLWWFERLDYSRKMFDMVRIDHFRAFSEYWSIPRGKKPKNGKWKKGPGMDFWNGIANKSGIIAENLGDDNENAGKLLEAVGIPGMRVFQFGIEGDLAEHLPHNYTNNSVAYTGTHDNNTLLAWLWELSAENRDYAFKYCGFYDEKWEDGLGYIIRTLLQSSAGTIILPIQDLCGFGGDTRMNTPGSAENNWAFRITEEQLSDVDTDILLEMNKLYKRWRG